MTLQRWLGLALAMCTACGEPPLPAPMRCTTTAACLSGYHCSPAGVCTGDVPCSADKDCCLAERCETRVCRPRQACSATAPCADAAMACASGMCVPKACSSDADCGGDRTCLWGLCSAAVPCGGRCPAGHACAARVDRCIDVTPAVTCPPGQLAVVENELNRMAEGCGALPFSVACRPLPAIAAGERGDPSVLLSLPGQLLHLSYDRTYGDVVMSRHDATPPFTQQSLQVLAGLPQGAQPVGAIDGPRGGVSEPGPDIGRALAAQVAADGQVHVAVRDDSADGVRYLRIDKGAVVADYLIASQPPGIGTSLALALSAKGQPLVTAFAPAAPAAQPPRPSRLLLWSAQEAAPASASAWQSSEIASESVAAPQLPCGGGCGSGKACVAGAAGESCAPLTQDCPACLPGQVCSAGTCRQRRVAPPPLAGGPRGRGAHVAMQVLSNGQVTVAAYSPDDRNLRFYRLASGSWTATTVDGATAQTADMGAFVRLVEGPGARLWAACEDSERGRLLLLRETANGHVVDVIDDGSRSNGLHRVGADVAMVRHPTGGLLIAHQDTRSADLMLQRVPQAGETSPATLATLRTPWETTDAAGFAPSIVQVGSKAWVVASTSLKISPQGQVSSTVKLRELVWAGD